MQASTDYIFDEFSVLVYPHISVV